MEFEKALKLRKDWADRFCHHPNIEVEVHQGAPTGNKVCSVCGRVIYTKPGTIHPTLS
jgi:hypothetical protein